jgi:hypothetical protein
MRTEGRPSQQTIVLVCRDTQYLYLAFHCLEQQPDGLVARRSNFVGYDGLTPVAEDLIEIMIDPSNSGAGNTSDVHHIVIKPTGAEICEIGLPTTPATGSHRFWPVDVRVGQVRVRDDRWIVEVRIPLSAFGPNALSNPVWGFNVARHQARLGEYASWSGATRHFYSPASMGNLSLPSP